MKKTLYLCLEIKVRELLPKIYLSYLAAKKKFRIYLGSREEIFNLILNKEKKAGIFFYKAGLQKEMTDMIDLKIDHHVVLDEEISPGFTKEQYKYRVLSFYREVIHKISLFFYVNKEIASIFKKQYPKVSSKKIFSTGWPRFEIIKKKNLKIFDKEVKIIKKKEKSFFLFISDFSYTTKNYEVFAREYFAWGVKKNQKKKNIENQIQEAKFHYEDFKIVSNFLLEYARKNSSIKIIIRSHPNESFKEWEKIIKVAKVKNIKLTKPVDDVVPWIIASSGILHRGCTTSIQSSILKKKIGYINLGKHNKKNKFFKNFLYSISNPIRCEKDLDTWIKKKFCTKAQSRVNKKLRRLNILQNNDSAKNIVNILDKLAIKKEYRSIIKKSNNNFYGIISLYKSLVLRKLLIFSTKIGLLQRNIDRFNFTHKIPGGISSKDVNYYLKMFKKKNDNMLAKKINDELVLIE